MLQDNSVEFNGKNSTITALAIQLVQIILEGENESNNNEHIHPP
jgi:hypothetical protein